MNVYLVGGAVRDQYLGLPVKERDFVVVGSTEEEMRRRGFQKVGKDFPVFLHPETHEEYALARTEYKTGTGHRGFACAFEPSTRLEDDLKRRDLTINAMAQDAQGHLIDPYGGLADLEHKILRHVSSAFQEDPLRIFRVARFHAQLEGFSIHPETLDMMKRMVTSGETQHLSKERIYRELKKALPTGAPWKFFSTLEEIGALDALMPEANLDHIRTQLSQVAPEDRWYALCHRQSDHTLRVLHNFPLTRSEQQLLRMHKACEDLASEPNAEHWYHGLKAMDAFRRRPLAEHACRVLTAVHHHDFIGVLQRIYLAWDQLTHPAHLSDARGDVVREFYDDALKKILEGAVPLA